MYRACCFVAAVNTINMLASRCLLLHCRAGVGEVPFLLMPSEACAAGAADTPAANTSRASTTSTTSTTSPALAMAGILFCLCTFVGGFCLSASFGLPEKAGRQHAAWYGMAVTLVGACVMQRPPGGTAPGSLVFTLGELSRA